MISDRRFPFALRRNQAHGQLDGRFPASRPVRHYVSAVSASRSGICDGSPGNRHTRQQQLAPHGLSLVTVVFPQAFPAEDAHGTEVVDNSRTVMQGAGLSAPGSPVSAGDTAPSLPPLSKALCED